MRHRILHSLLLGLSLVCFSASAIAAPELDDDPPWALSLGLVDPEPQHDLWVDGASTGSLWVSIQATFVRTDDGRNDFAATAMLGVPLERLGRGPVRIAERATLPVLPPPIVEPAEASDRIEPATIVTPNMARDAIAAAMEHARIEKDTARLQRLATRARSSALLPELRLRVTRQLDDAQVLSPTEYDPDRVTATVKASLWLEARATFKLDKLVFADEEVTLERMRDDRIEEAKKLREKVLETLFAWQRAVFVRDDVSIEPEKRMKAAFDVVEAEVKLDVLTGGWFSKWKASH